MVLKGSPKKEKLSLMARNFYRMLKVLNLDRKRQRLDFEVRIFYQIFCQPKDNFEFANLIQLNDCSDIVNFSF